MMILLFIVIFIFLFLGFIVSTAATELYRNPEELIRLAAEKTRKQRWLTRIMANPPATVFIVDAFKAFSLLLITVAGLKVAHISSQALPAYTLFWYIGGLLLLWFFYVLVVEVFPKYRALISSESKLLRYLWLIGPIYLLFKPLTGLLRHSQERPGDNPALEEKKEEIVERALESFAESAGMGEPLIEQEEKKMIGQILRLDTTLVKEIMVPRVNILWINHRAPLAEVKELVKTSGHSRLPVCRETVDEVLGILYVKDLIYIAVLEPTPDWSLYVRKPYFVPETKRVDELLDELRAQKSHIAIVVDEYGGTAGLVTLEDILEEIVGEIHDEYDKGEIEIQKLDDTTFRVAATVRVESLNEALGSNLPSEQFETVGGLIYALVGSLPEEGKIVEHGGLKFKVEKVVGQRIKKILVAKQSAPVV